MSSTSSGVPRIELAPGYSIARLLNGAWQLSRGHTVAHGADAAPVEAQDAVEMMLRLAEAGFTTFDGADIYGGVEEIFGRFLATWRERHGNAALEQIQVHTKCVPDRDSLEDIRQRDVEALIDRSLERLGVERLDLVQYHWWDYSVPGHVEAALWLKDLQAAGKIRLVGVTNYDTEHLRELVDAGVEIAAHQVQYSLLDRRPEHGMTGFCAENGIHLLCYGTLAGGFLAQRYRGAEEPGEPFENRSLRKYKLVIDELGSWSFFQRLLDALAEIGEKHGVSPSNVAVRWVLERDTVAGAIVGARHARHLADNLRVAELELDTEDHERLAGVLAQGGELPGDTFSLERVPDGPHRLIMKTNLNRDEA